MAAAEPLEQVYKYPFASRLQNDGARSQLALAASSMPVSESLYFSGSLDRPDVAAGLLLATSEVALQRYYYPPGMVAAMIRAADPVVTAADTRLRFESFSQCCGVYARADMLPDMLRADEFGKGTTNVDFNPPMRAALSKVRSGNSLDLRVTPESVAISSDVGSAVEHKVKLPVRWLKGFAEVQALAAGLEHRARLTGPAARQFLAGLTNQVKSKERVWLVPAGAGLRQSQRATGEAIASAALGRLAALKPLARHAGALNVYGSDTGVSGFELDFGFARFMLILSALASRGFSGEGQLLKALGSSDADVALARVKATLKWQSGLKPVELARDLDLPRKQVSAALALLAAQGLVGMDPREGSFFHRELPFDLSRIEGLHPRLKSARQLHASGAVKQLKTANGAFEAIVESDGVDHRVLCREDDFRCTCTWYARTLGESGPCKHVLAVMQAADEEGARRE
ncbi:MAG: SWIM zinc finger family protein [Rhizobiales bacterium]|nr:SWIM zinc finger family protein [Hyphomicrobiales bacterium]